MVGSGDSEAEISESPASLHADVPSRNAALATNRYAITLRKGHTAWPRQSTDPPPESARRRLRRHSLFPAARQLLFPRCRSKPQFLPPVPSLLRRCLT